VYNGGHMKDQYSDKLGAIRRYYDRRESRWGYALLLRGRKHFGYYPSNQRHVSIARAQQLMEKQLADRMALGRGARVLDAGSGEGIVASFLASHYGCNIVGIDLLERNLAVARRNAAAIGVSAGVEFIQGSYLDTALDDCSFDGVYTMETLVHAPNAAQALTELYRVLKPGGRLVCFEYTMPADSDMDERMRRVFALIVSGSGMHSLPKFVNGSLGDQFREAGFIDVVVDDLSDRIMPMLRFLARLGWLPYKLACKLRQEQHFINALSGVELYRYRDQCRYVAVTAMKPSAAD
jgi:sterol 24-C-methyltransferase